MTFIYVHENMPIFRLMVHAQQVKETRAKRKSRDAKRARSFDGGSSKGWLDIEDKPRFEKRVSNQVPSKFPKARDDRVFNPKPKKRRILVHQPRKLVKGVARGIIVIALKEQIIVFSLV